MNNNLHFYMQDVGNHECPIHQFDTPPKIDFHLWSVDQAIFLIKDRAANKCCFYSDYFGVGKKLHSRVKLAREWLDDNHSKYLCLANSGADATSKCDKLMGKPTSKDGHIIVFAIVC